MKASVRKQNPVSKATTSRNRHIGKVRYLKLQQETKKPETTTHSQIIHLTELTFNPITSAVMNRWMPGGATASMIHIASPCTLHIFFGTMSKPKFPVLPAMEATSLQQEALIIT